MNISPKDGILIKIYICEKVWCTKAVEWIARQGLETWKHRQSAEDHTRPEQYCPATRQWRTAFGA